MRASKLLGLMIAVASICAPSAAQADYIDGDISVTMNYKPNCGDDLADCDDLNTATGLDFIFTSGGAETPGIAGLELVTQATDDMAYLVGTLGLVKDFSFSGAGTANFPTPVIAEWEMFDGGLTFDMLTVTVIFQGLDSLLLVGTGTFHHPDFDDTPGVWRLSANQSGETFSASASKGALDVPDGGSTAALLGSLLVAFGIVRRRFI